MTGDALMPSLFSPRMVFKSAAHISPEFLHARGIRALMLDLDGTLCPSHSDAVPDWVAPWLSRMKEAGISLFMLSNNRRPGRVADFCAAYGIPAYLTRAGKPKRAGFREALRLLSLPASACALVGDQIYTDVLGANRMGIQSIFVYSMDYHIWYYRLRHLLELPFLPASGRQENETQKPERGPF